MQYGKITVIKKSEDKLLDYVIRKFEISGVPPKSMAAKKSQLSPSYIVTQYQYLAWPPNGKPTSTASLLEVIENVEKVQMSTGNKAITVMCK